MHKWFKMDTLNIIFGAVTIVAFIFAIYSHFSTQKKKMIESAKIVKQQERLRCAMLSVKTVIRMIDAIVQAPKSGIIDPKYLQNMAREARYQGIILAQQMEDESKQIDGWKFGEYTETHNNANPPDKENPPQTP